MRFTTSLKNEYQELYDSLEINPARLPIIDRHINEIEEQKEKYETAVNAMDCPWYFVALIHTMESNRDFDTHLHNGDPLTSRTVRVPSNRPLNGTPPFSWEESAEDALKLKRLDEEEDWSLPKILYQFERYNGFGYRSRQINTPYLWSFSNHYTQGKFVADGQFSPTAVSQQIGTAVMLKRMEERAIITNPNLPTPADEDRPSPTPADPIPAPDPIPDPVTPTPPKKRSFFQGIVDFFKGFWSLFKRKA